MRDSRIIIAALLLFAGCEKDLLDSVHDAGPDSAPGVDAPPACMAPMTDAHPAPMYTLYINFEGVTLTRCSDGGNSHNNCSDLLQADTTFAPFLDGVAARDSFIASILFPVRKALAPYSIDVVTARPASGNYYMMVVGGTPDQLGLPTDVQSFSPASCDGANRNAVNIVFDHGQAPVTALYASNILSNLGVLAAIPATTAPANDCLCRVNGCNWADQVCVFGANSTVVTDPQFMCARTTVDEPAILQLMFGCR